MSSSFNIFLIMLGFFDSCLNLMNTFQEVCQYVAKTNRSFRLVEDLLGAFQNLLKHNGSLFQFLVELGLLDLLAGNTRVSTLQNLPDEICFQWRTNSCTPPCAKYCNQSTVMNWPNLHRSHAFTTSYIRISTLGPLLVLSKVVFKTTWLYLRWSWRHFWTVPKMLGRL